MPYFLNDNVNLLFTGHQTSNVRPRSFRQASNSPGTKRPRDVGPYRANMQIGRVFQFAAE
jgi:hypothetical protein